MTDVLRHVVELALTYLKTRKRAQGLGIHSGPNPRLRAPAPSLLAGSVPQSGTTVRLDPDIQARLKVLATSWGLRLHEAIHPLVSAAE
jgi:hypothetical protein